MPMPETPVDKDDRAIPPQNNVGPSGQPWMIQPIAEPPAEQELPHQYLRLGVLASYGSHAAVALLLGHFVHAVTQTSARCHVCILFRKNTNCFSSIQEYSAKNGRKMIEKGYMNISSIIKIHIKTTHYETGHMRHGIRDTAYERRDSHVGRK